MQILHSECRLDPWSAWMNIKNTKRKRNFKYYFCGSYGNGVRTHVSYKHAINLWDFLPAVKRVEGEDQRNLSNLNASFLGRE